MKLGIIDVSNDRELLWSFLRELPCSLEVVGVCSDTIDNRRQVRFRRELLEDDWSSDQLLRNPSVDYVVILCSYHVPLEVIQGALDAKKGVLATSAIFGNGEEATAFRRAMARRDNAVSVFGLSPFAGGSAMERFVLDEAKLGIVEEFKFNLISDDLAINTSISLGPQTDLVASSVSSMVPYIAWMKAMGGDVIYFEVHQSNYGVVMDCHVSVHVGTPAQGPALTVIGALNSGSDFLFRISPFGTLGTSSEFWVVGASGMLRYKVGCSILTYFGGDNKGAQEFDLSKDKAGVKDLLCFASEYDSVGMRTSNMSGMLDLGYGMRIANTIEQAVGSRTRVYV